MTCWLCGGSGEYVTCIDDLCHGQEQCIHGDPPSPCPECKGTGGEDGPDDDYEDDDDPEACPHGAAPEDPCNICDPVAESQQLALLEVEDLETTPRLDPHQVVDESILRGRRGPIEIVRDPMGRVA